MLNKILLWLFPKNVPAERFALIRREAIPVHRVGVYSTELARVHRKGGR